MAQSRLPLRPDQSTSAVEYDPEFLQARREMLVILILFSTVAVWSIGTCLYMGYPDLEASKLSLADASGRLERTDLEPSDGATMEPTANPSTAVLERPVQLSMVLGLPAWVFWGIVLPWLVVDVVAVWFCFVWMRPGAPEPAGRQESRP